MANSARSNASSVAASFAKKRKALIILNPLRRLIPTKTVVRAPHVRRRVRVVVRPARRVHKAAVAVANIAPRKVVKRRVLRRVAVVRKVVVRNSAAATRRARSVTTVVAVKSRTAIAKAATCAISPAPLRVKVDSAVASDRVEFRLNKASASLLESQ